MKPARIYLRVSTESQDLERQRVLIEEANEKGYYVAGVYEEKASAANGERPALTRLIHDLQQGDVLICEKLDRLTRLPFPEAEKLIAKITEKGAKLSVPDVLDLSEVAEQADGLAKIVLENIQALLLKIALHMCREEYETRRARQLQGIANAVAKGKYKGKQRNRELHARILKLRKNHTLTETATLAGCSLSTVKFAVSLAKLQQA